MKILVTGANGFAGKILVPLLRRGGHHVRALSRDEQSDANETFKITDLATVNWTRAVEDVEVVLHLAGLAHVLREKDGDPLAAYRAANVAPTRTLAEAARASGTVRRVIFLSSVKALSDESADHPLREGEESAATSPYGISKREAEQALAETLASGATDWVALRPPLLYGPGVKGNLRLLATLIRWGVPLPLGALDNHRSVLGVENLADFLLKHGLASPAISRKILHIADPEPVGTGSIARFLGAAEGRQTRLFAFPLAGLLQVLRPGLHARLCGDLVLDTARLQELTGWRPPFSTGEGFRRIPEDPARRGVLSSALPPTAF